jgi:hypothetical protein
MIIVTGPKRSGTSLWMQLLGAAGLTVIGDPFPLSWGESIRASNPDGFYESRLRGGIWFATNPDPKTGAWLHPRTTREHAVKVFIPGLIRSDYAFLHRVIATLRPWRAAVASLRRLHQQEEDWVARRDLSPDLRDSKLAALRKTRGELPLAVEWWFEVYDLVRDASTRRYPVHFTTLERLQQQPEEELGRVFGWLGVGDPSAARPLVRPLAATPGATDPSDPAITEEQARVFDAVYANIHQHGKLPRPLLDAMNQVQHDLEARYRGRTRREDALES